MNFPEKIIAILKDAKKPLKSSQILTLLKKNDPKITIDKKDLNQIIWKDLRQKIIYNTLDFTIILKGSSIEPNSNPNVSSKPLEIITTPSNPFDVPASFKNEINLGDVLKIVSEEKIRLGTHEANLMAENITIRLKNKYGAN
jgi:hypothetical protein